MAWRNASATMGLVQGGLSELMYGGGFETAFLGTFAGSALGAIGAEVKNQVYQTMKAAVIGGTVSKIGGGKFANGAAYAAFSYAVASASSKGSTVGRGGSDDIPEVVPEVLESTATTDLERLRADLSVELDKAIAANPDIEYRGFIVKRGDEYLRTNIVTSNHPTGVKVPYNFAGSDTVVLDIHNHPGKDWGIFSPDDVEAGKYWSSQSSEFQGMFLRGTKGGTRVYRVGDRLFPRDRMDGLADRGSYGKACKDIRTC